MPKIGSEYPKDNYHKEYYLKNKDKECYKYKPKCSRHYNFQITINGETYTFQKRNDIINLIKKINICDSEDSEDSLE